MDRAILAGALVVQRLPINGARRVRALAPAAFRQGSQPLRRTRGERRPGRGDQPAPGKIVDEQPRELRAVARAVEQAQGVRRPLRPGRAQGIAAAQGARERRGRRDGGHRVCLQSVWSKLTIAAYHEPPDCRSRNGRPRRQNPAPPAPKTSPPCSPRAATAFTRTASANCSRGGHWDELNDRFYTTLAFGTGGLRGRTIGKIVTAAERGDEPQPLGRPQYPCVGTNAMNFYNISRATQGLVRYLKKWVAEHGAPARRSPSSCIAYDTRHFSRDFADLTAKVASENGCDVNLFEGPRSTPELSFAVRLTNAQAGIVITASHNPPHDNGYKVYFDQGAQIVEPQAGGIIAEVNAVTSETYEPLHGAARGEITMLGAEIDAAYLERLKTLVLDPAMLARARGDCTSSSPPSTARARCSRCRCWRRSSCATRPCPSRW